MMHIYAKFERRQDAESAFADLIGGGLGSCDLTLLVPLPVQGEIRVTELNEENIETSVDGGFLDPAAEFGFACSALGAGHHEAEGSLRFESSVGGGISTCEPADDVSAIEEMDDSESVAEETLYPESGESFGEQDIHDVRRLSDTGFLRSVDAPLGLEGRHDNEDRLLAGLYQELSVLTLPGFGVVIGEGPLATEVETLALQGGHGKWIIFKYALRKMGCMESRIEEIFEFLKNDRPLLVVSLTFGEADPIEVQSRIEGHGGVPMFSAF